jgi:hypothetical protein
MNLEAMKVSQREVATSSPLHIIPASIAHRRMIKFSERIGSDRTDISGGGASPETRRGC